MSSTDTQLIIGILTLCFSAANTCLGMFIPMATIYLKQIKKSSCLGSNIEREVSPRETNHQDFKSNLENKINE